jgi:hypothetical protein
MPMGPVGVGLPPLDIEQIYLLNPITSNQADDLFYCGQSPYGTSDDAAIKYSDFAAQFGAPYTPSALTAFDDTNITLTLGGSPSNALINPASITAGWNGQLSMSRGGTNANLTASNNRLVYSTASALALLATANDAVLATDSGGAPSLSSTLPLTVQTNITRLGTITLGTWNASVVSEVYGGTNQASYTLGDTLYASAANTLSKLSGNTTAVKQYLSQTGTGTLSAAPSWSTISGGDITGAALTKTDDTNVTLTLGGSPTAALLRATSLTLGWTGQLAVPKGGSGAATLTGLLTGNGTSAFTGTAITQYNVLTGGTSNLPNSVAPSATSGIPLISQGSTSQPLFGTALVAGGGSGLTSTTAYGLLAGGTTSTGNFQNVGTGTTGQVLQGAGSASLPTWTNLSTLAVTSVVGTANQISTSASTGSVTISMPAVLGIGSSNTLSGNTQLTLNSNNKIALEIDGTVNGGNAADILLGVFNNQTFNPTLGALKIFSGAFSPLINIPSTKTVTTTAAITAQIALFSGVGTATNAYNVYAPTFGNGNSTITNAFGAYFESPTGATNNIGLYTDSLSVGYTGVNLTSNASLFSGAVAIGTSTIATTPLGAGTARAYLTLTGGDMVFGSTVSDYRALQVSGGTSYGYVYGQATSLGEGLNLGYNYFIDHGNTAHIINTGLGTSRLKIADGNFLFNVGATNTAPTQIGQWNSTGLKIGTSGTAAVALDVAGPGYIGSGESRMWNGTFSDPLSGVAAALKMASTGGAISLASTTTSRYNIYLSGSQTAVDASNNQAGLYVNNTLNPTNGGTIVAGAYILPTIVVPTGKTVSAFVGCYIKNLIASGANLGTTSSSIGLWIDQDGVSPTGTFTSAYNLYVSQPFPATVGNYYAASLQGGLVLHRSTLSSSTTINSSYCITGVTSTAAARTVTLPATVPDSGWTLIVKDESGGAATNNITVAGNGHNIDASASLNITTNYGVLRIYSNGSQYYTF